MRRQAGITMVEIMVAVLLVSIAAAFTFGIQIRASGAFRDQATVSELQQTLRAVSDLLVKDLRLTGYRATLLRVNGSADRYAVTVQNAAGGYGSDILYLQYGDDSKLAHVAQGTASSYSDPQTEVTAVGGFKTNDLAIISSRSIGTSFNHGCIVQITTADPGPPAVLHYVANPPWNVAGNPQCNELSPVWTDGNTSFSGAALRAYRVRPGDQRGILERSPSGGLVANDWEPLAVGVVDLQVAIRVFQPTDAADDDGDGDATRDWYSGDNMGTALALVANSAIIQVSVTVIAKSSKEIGGPTLQASPAALGSPSANNNIGDHAGVTLPVTDTTSPFYGDFVYRMYTSMVDLRNVGVGL